MNQRHLHLTFPGIRMPYPYGGDAAGIAAREEARIDKKKTLTHPRKCLAKVKIAIFGGRPCKNETTK